MSATFSESPEANRWDNLVAYIFPSGLGPLPGLKEVNEKTDSDYVL